MHVRAVRRGGDPVHWQGRGVTRREEGRGQDEFMSSEVNDRTTQPMKDSKTRR